MSEKKISFGFSKINKKPNILATQSPTITKKVQLIECFEGKSIKIKDAVEIVHTPLVIPIQPSDKNLLERVQEAKLLRERSRKQYEPSKPNEPVDSRPDSELSLDELAARQLIKESQSLLKPVHSAAKVTVVPAVEDTLILEGSKEPTLDDYENVPIGDFGMAMLRGMGWKETKVDKDKNALNSTPELRPKGMGLGAYKLVNEEKPQKPAIDKEGKELTLVKGAFAKIIAGKHKGFYCKVEGLDDEAGRIIVKLAIKGVSLSLNEFLLTPVTKEEYSQSGKVLNNSKYEEYKEKQDRQAVEIKVEKEERSTTKHNDFPKEEKTIKQERNRRYSSSEESELIKNQSKKSSRDRRSRSYDEYDKKQRVTEKNTRDNSPVKDKSRRKRNSSESSDSSDSYKKKSKKNKHKSRSDDRTKSKKKKSKKHRSRDSSTDSERRSKSVKSKERKSDKREELSSDDERKYRKSSHKSSKHRK